MKCLHSDRVKSTMKVKLAKMNTTVMMEVLVRVILACIFILTESLEPFKREIHLNEVWLYKYPSVDSYFPDWMLLITCCILPLAVIFLNFLVKKDWRDVKQAIYCVSLVFLLNGLITNVIKLTVGRPRPDYFHRCFPDGLPEGKELLTKECTGSPHVVTEGRKSFPSGHSSCAFSCLGFISLYIAGKLHVFSWARGEAWRLLLTIAPLVAAAMIAVSRTCDYHHHWQDVVAGALLGYSLAYCSYFQYYPPLVAVNAHKPLISLTSRTSNNSDADINHKTLGTIRFV